MSLDTKALKILTDHHWVPGMGWSKMPPEGAAFEYAKRAGYMFDDLVTRHDTLAENLIELVRRCDITDIADAFLASLTTRRLDLRSALSSYAIASRFPRHWLDDSPTRVSPYTGAVFCEVCGGCDIEQRMEINLNVLNFERFKWGGVRKLDLPYIFFDLAEFEKTEKIAPKPEDYEILQEIISIISKVPDGKRASSLDKRLSGVFKSNSAERRSLIETLGICGILQPANRMTYFDGFVETRHQEYTGEHRKDWGYPVIWWQGSDGVNDRAVRHYFPNL